MKIIYKQTIEQLVSSYGYSILRRKDHKKGLSYVNIYDNRHKLVGIALNDNQIMEIIRIDMKEREDYEIVR